MRWFMRQSATVQERVTPTMYRIIQARYGQLIASAEANGRRIRALIK